MPSNKVSLNTVENGRERDNHFLLFEVSILETAFDVTHRAQIRWCHLAIWYLDERILIHLKWWTTTSTNAVTLKV